MMNDKKRLYEYKNKCEDEYIKVKGMRDTD
jgi:hypothetical protein